MCGYLIHYSCCLSLKSLPALRNIDLSSNERLSHLELNEETSISAILIQGCAFQSITDILKCCPSLRELSCSYNKLTELDLSGCSNISELRCEHNQLTRLIIYYPTPPRQYRISFNDNPGADDRNRSIFNGR